MIMFVTVDMSAGQITPNIFNFTGGVTGRSSGTHASIFTAVLLRRQNKLTKKNIDFSSFVDFDH